MTHNTQHINLVPASTDYQDKVYDIYNRAYYDVVVAQFGPWDQEQQKEFFLDSWNQPTTKVIMYDNQLCGYYVVTQTPDGPFVYELVIDPAYQGKGIGAHILRNLQQESVEKNEPVSLEVFHKNVRARALYERLGFTASGQTETHVQMRWQPTV